MARPKPKEKSGEEWRPEFEQAMGESFAECTCPPVPFQNMISDECCEVVRMVAGDRVTPATLATMTKADIARLGKAFGEYFESTAPSVAQIKAALGGDLSRVERIVKLGVFINSAPDFTDQPEVANGASNLMEALFGEAGKHARSAVGVAALPRGAAGEAGAGVKRADEITQTY